MYLDRILHERKNFAELEDSDIVSFLRERRFRSEHLNLEFKSGFPKRTNGKYDLRGICKYIVGFSNEEGGVIVYGVSDNVRDSAVSYPSYVVGLERYPSTEDLSQWVRDRVHPLVASPSIRFFDVEGRKIAVVKIPPGVNKPYCYYDNQSKSLTFFKKTSGGIAELGPDEIREFYRSSMIDQAVQLLRAHEAQEGIESNIETVDTSKFKRHQELTFPKLENIRDYGFFSIYCAPVDRVTIPVDRLEMFLNEHRLHFSEVMRYFANIEILQNGVSAGYFPRAINPDIKSTARITMYEDGLVAFDSQADHLMDKPKKLNPFWLAYEVQRHLQLSKAVLWDYSITKRIRCTVDLANIQDWVMIFDRAGISSRYSGVHRPIEREIALLEVHDFDGVSRNIVMPSVKGIMDEICRVFGLSSTLSGPWNQSGKLGYVEGLEGQR